MAAPATTLDTIGAVAPSGQGGEDCRAMGGRGTPPRRCTSCGHGGCCDSPPNRHATQHFRTIGHPIVQSYEPGEEWYWCFVDQLAFEMEEEGPSPAHP